MNLIGVSGISFIDYAICFLLGFFHLSFNQVEINLHNQYFLTFPFTNCKAVKIITAENVLKQKKRHTHKITHPLYCKPGRQVVILALAPLRS
jgi:hypothetical protein